jgi:hypothetical protein
MAVSFMFNSLWKTIHPIEEDALDVDESQVFLNLYHGSENVFNSLKFTAFHFLLHHSKEPEVAQTHIWRTG